MRPRMPAHPGRPGTDQTAPLIGYADGARIGIGELLWGARRGAEANSRQRTGNAHTAPRPPPDRPAAPLGPARRHVTASRLIHSQIGQRGRQAKKNACSRWGTGVICAAAAQAFYFALPPAGTVLPVCGAPSCSGVSKYRKPSSTETASEPSSSYSSFSLSLRRTIQPF